MKKYTPLSIVIIVITLVLSGCAGAAVAAIPAASSVTITIGDLVIGFSGIPGDTIPLERVCAEAPEYCPTGKAVLRMKHTPKPDMAGHCAMADDCLNSADQSKRWSIHRRPHNIDIMDQNSKFIVKS
jgi:hypothetical protein